MDVYKSLTVIQEMLLDRGYKNDQISEIEKYQIDEIESIKNVKPIFTVSLPSANITLLYVLSSKSRLQDIRKVLDSNSEFSGLYILIVKDKINSSDQKKIHSLANFQIFELSELQFNISKHELVPKHELITEDQDIKTVIDGYQLKSRNQLPFILKSDPMARYLNAKPGNLVKVTRISPTCGVNIVYRVCV